MNSFVHAMNSKYYLPDYIIVLLDDDLIDYLQYKKFNTANLLGPWIEYLMQTFAEEIQNRFQQLPSKAKLELITQVYWVEPVPHVNFSYTDQQARDIFGKCLEVNCKNTREHACAENSRFLGQKR